MEKVKLWFEKFSEAWWTEAFVTGIGAGILALLFHKIVGER